MSRLEPQINIRIAPALKERLILEGKKNKRSMNAEIIHRLLQTFDDFVLPEGEEGERTVSKTIEKIEQHLQAIRSMMEQQHKQIGPEVQEHHEAGTSVPLIAYERKHNAIK